MQLRRTQQVRQDVAATMGRLFGVMAMLVMLGVSQSMAGTFLAFGPENYLRADRAPVIVTRNFSVLNPATPYTLRIANGGLTDGQLEKVSSTVITLNGVQVVGPNEFNQTIAVIEKPVVLVSTNVLAVELRGKPGGGLTLQVIGMDNDLPTITATAAPPPNAAGWNQSNVTVSFSCTDVTSGIATCPAPVVVATEGPAQLVQGTATDRAGNSATATATISLDRTGPSLTITSPVAGATLAMAEAQVTRTVSDALSGLAAVTCNGSAASVNGANFTCQLRLNEGANIIEARATDIAGGALCSQV